MDWEVKKMIAVTGSGNNCLRCHTDALRAHGATDEETADLLRVVDFFSGSNAVASGLNVECTPPLRPDGLAP